MSTPANGGRADGSSPEPAWADAILEGERPARDSLVPPTLPLRPSTSPLSSRTPRASYAPPPTAARASYPLELLATAETPPPTAIIPEAPVPESAYPNAKVSPWGALVAPPEGAPRTSFDLAAVQADHEPETAPAAVWPALADPEPAPGAAFDIDVDAADTRAAHGAIDSSLARALSSAAHARVAAEVATPFEGEPTPLQVLPDAALDPTPPPERAIDPDPTPPPQRAIDPDPTPPPQRAIAFGPDPTLPPQRAIAPDPAPRRALAPDPDPTPPPQRAVSPLARALTPPPRPIAHTDSTPPYGHPVPADLAPALDGDPTLPPQPAFRPDLSPPPRPVSGPRPSLVQDIALPPAPVPQVEAAPVSQSAEVPIEEDAEAVAALTASTAPPPAALTPAAAAAAPPSLAAAPPSLAVAPPPLAAAPPPLAPPPLAAAPPPLARAATPPPLARAATPPPLARAATPAPLAAPPLPAPAPPPARDVLAALDRAEPDRLPTFEAAPAASRSIDLLPELNDTSDLVELEALDEAFASVFEHAPPAAAAPRDVALISATGDLVYPPPAPARVRAEGPLTEPERPPPLPQAPLARRRELLPPKGEVVLGIDLGTTYTCAAVVEAKHASVLASRWGSPTIPSVVAILPDGRMLVGEAALRHNTDPRRLIVGSKRIFGRSYHSPIVQEARDHFAYEVVEGASGDAAVRVDGKVVELETVAAAILREIRESASLQIEGMVNRAVITCPAHFNERQRESIRVAGELAGFHVERVLSEPTAAALHFGLGQGMNKRKVLVYDLGGGTFDVSLLEVDGDTFQVIGTGGDTFLGGLDFDACIADVVVEAFLEKEHIDARSDPVAVARILEFAERAKRELTDRSSTIVQIDHLTVQPHAPRAITVPIRRARVEELWLPLVDHTVAIVEQMLTRANVSPADIHEVLLVGGQSRTPLVQKRMEQLFGRKLGRDVNPEEAIALGAAQLGDTLAHASHVTLVDVLPMSIGVGLPGGRYKRILERETRLPAERSYTLRSTRDDQTRFEVALFQGEDENIHNDEPLGVVELKDLPKGPKGTIAVIITLRVTSNQVLEVEARETKSGKFVRAQLATQHTTESIRKKLGLKAAPTGGTGDLTLRPKRVRKRPTGVWGWLTSLFRRR